MTTLPFDEAHAQAATACYVDMLILATHAAEGGDTITSTEGIADRFEELALADITALMAAGSAFLSTLWATARQAHTGHHCPWATDPEGVLRSVGDTAIRALLSQAYLVAVLDELDPEAES